MSFFSKEEICFINLAVTVGVHLDFYNCYSCLAKGGLLLAKLVKLVLKFGYSRNFEIQAFRKEQHVKQKPIYNEHMESIYTCVLIY